MEAAEAPPSGAEVYEIYRAQEKLYEGAADAYRERILEVLTSNGIPVAMSESRHKRPLEFLKKQRRKQYSDPWVDCPDLVGVRVVVPLLSDRESVVRAISSSAAFGSIEVEDQTGTGSPEILAYKGLHVHLGCDDLLNAQDRPIRCELQVRTTAEHSWASTEHKYVYKKSKGLPYEVQRVFKRLLVLVELFDQELSKGVEMVKTLPAWEEFSLVQRLEDVFEEVAGIAGDQEITRENVELLSAAIGKPFSDLRACLESYVASGLQGVGDLLFEHGPASAGFDPDRGWLTSQPEIILVMALLEEDEYLLSSGLARSDAYEYVEPVALWTNHPGFVRA
jgi:ppGpp synthetase/RelA/SpoT-type nucleotidyltranferase